jgi:hypothetical protein
MHYQHKIKCLNCSLHFIVLSDLADWPGLEEADADEAADAKIHCPECGQTKRFIRWQAEEHDEFIFQVVPGESASRPMGLIT